MKNRIQIGDRVKKDLRHGTVVAQSPLTTKKVQVHWDGVPPRGGHFEWYDRKSLRLVGI